MLPPTPIATHSSSWGWVTLFLLGAYHGLNPGMGWLFAVALGMQEHSSNAVARSLVPIAIGHAAAIGLAILLAGLVQVVLPLDDVRIVVAATLVALGLYRIIRKHHFQWSKMRVRFHDLVLWSFLMASAHGAGLMVLPVVMGLSAVQASAMEHMHSHGLQEPVTGIWATVVHTLGYFVVTAIIALLVYQKFGLSMLRKAWFNLDLVWAAALIVTGCLALLL
jgi:hypothetical protein